MTTEVTTGEIWVPMDVQPVQQENGLHFPWATFLNNGHVHTCDREGTGGENWNANDYPSENRYAAAIKRTPYENPAPYNPGDVVELPEPAYYRDGDARVVYQDGALKTQHGQRYLSGRNYGAMKQPEVDELLRYGWQLKSADEMPAWAIRKRTIGSQGVPELRGGVWGWKYT
jgi:hypothetical protein